MDLLQSLSTYVLVVPAVALVLAARRRGPLTVGVGRDGLGAQLGAGLLFGAGAAAVLLGALVGLELTDPRGWTGDVGPSLGIAAYFAVLFLIEEVVFRGWFLPGLAALTSWPVAVAAVSVLVALPYSFAEHTSGLAVVGAAVSNAVIALARWRTGRIWFGWGMRITWNSAFVALGLPDSAYRLEHPLLHQAVVGRDWLSGGLFGPEAGVVGLAVLLVMAGLLTRLPKGLHRPSV